MKTKNIIIILATLTIAAGLIGCKSDEETEAKPAKEILIVEGGNDITLRSGDSIMSVNITADCAWTTFPVTKVPPSITPRHITITTNFLCKIPPAFHHTPSIFYHNKMKTL